MHRKAAPILTCKPTLLVSRHHGAQRWLLAEARARGWAPVQLLSHLDADGWQHAGRVAGSLPLPLISTLCAAGIPVWQIELPLSRDKRGRELSSSDMMALGARLRQVRVEYLEETI